MRRTALSAILVSFILLASVITTAQAQESGPKLGQPVYDAQAKRYFEMVNPSGTPAGGGVPWQTAWLAAKRRVFKGVRGRLAVVDSPEIHQFLLTTFRPDAETWIGLVYWCDTRKLQWMNGAFVRPGDFQAWDKQWKQDIYACHSSLENVKREYAPVAYSKQNTWIAKGMHKWYVYYFVEYPTGAP